MADIYREDPIDREEVGEYFPQIFDVFSNTAGGKYTFFINIKNDYAYWSDDTVEYFGLSGNRVFNPVKVWANKIHPLDRKMFLDNIEEVFSGRLEEHDLTYRITNKYDEYITCSCRGRVIYNDLGERLYFAGTLINHQNNVFIDPVTGLYNRISLFSRLEELHRNKKKYYFLMTGLKHFFKVNYSYGYDFGNKILNTLADIWRDISDNNMVFRTEGTKAVMIFEMSKYTKEEVEKTYREVLDKFKKGVIVENHTVFLSFYACLYQSDNLDLDINTIYNCSIFADNKAKREEINEIFQVTDELFSGNKFLMEKLEHIRNCIPDNFKGFYLVYQPIVSAQSGELIGVETLIRWKDEAYGFVPPSEFIEWLEGDAVFYDLGNWIIRQAIRDTRKIVEKYPDMLININLAYPQLQNSNFNADLCKIMEAEGFNPKNFNLELTERCKFSNLETLKSSIAFFKSMGISSALDDFGTGYSALDLMMELQVDEIKIDKSFIKDIDEDCSRQSLLKAITVCADELGKKICVEGIETDIMADYLYNHFKVTKYQGYYFSKPLEKDNLIEWAVKNKEDFAK